MTKTQLFIGCVKAGLKGGMYAGWELAKIFFIGIWFGAGLWLGISAMSRILN